MKQPLFMRSESMVENNREMAAFLKSKGYRFEFNGKGYMVWHKDEFLHGAGTVNIAKHWRHREANSKMYLFNAVCVAYDHYKKG